MNFLKKNSFRLIVILCLCAVIQQGPSLLALLSKSAAKFQVDSPLSMVADISHLEPAQYYLSAGRILTKTEVKVDSTVLVEDNLTLGLPILISQRGQFHTLRIRWDDNEPWRNHLYDFPVLTNSGIGVLIQAWRSFNAVFMGPVLSLLLLILILAHSKISFGFTTRLRPHLILTTTCFAYTFCLSGIPDLFLPPEINTLSQILLRVAFSFSFIFLIGSYGKQNRLLLLLHGPCALVIALSHLFFRNWLIPIYQAEISIFALLTLISSIELARVAHDRSARLVTLLAFTWTILQTVAVIVYVTSGPTYLAVWSPSFVAVLIASDFYLIFRQAIDLSTEAESTRKMFRIAGQVAHDIRSPLAALRTLISRLHVTNDENELAVLAFNRIAGIAKDVLDEYRPNAITQVGLHKITLLVEAAIREKKVEFPQGPVFSYKSELSHQDILAKLDPKQLARILSNILNNSIEATTSLGNISVLISETRNFVNISICDDGIGMTPEVLALIQADAKSVGKSTGYGLGLSHAQSYIQSWGGQLEVKSKSGCGTTVLLHLLRADKLPGTSKHLT